MSSADFTVRHGDHVTISATGQGTAGLKSVDGVALTECVDTSGDCTGWIVARVTDNTGLFSFDITTTNLENVWDTSVSAGGAGCAVDDCTVHLRAPNNIRKGQYYLCYMFSTETADVLSVTGKDATAASTVITVYGPPSRVDASPRTLMSGVTAIFTSANDGVGVANNDKIFIVPDS